MKIQKSIIEWLKNYTQNSNLGTFVVGVSGGIDSALVSTLCAETGIKTIVVSMPIHQHKSELCFQFGTKFISRIRYFCNDVCG